MERTPGVDYYEVLGVPTDATPETIERAYRERVKQVHPDRNEAPDAASAFARVREARAVLTDTDERERYDRLGHDEYLGATNRGSASGRTSASTNQPGERARATAGPWTTTSDGRQGGGETGSTTGPTRAGEWNGETTRYAVRTTHEVTRQLTWGGLTPPQAAIGIAMFMIYPGLLVGAVTPGFSPILNLLVSLFLLFVVAVLLSMPRVGLVVFGAWLVVGPPLLLLTGVGVVSLAGGLFVLGNLVPFCLALANFVVSGGG